MWCFGKLLAMATKPGNYIKEVDPSIADRMVPDLKEQGFELTQPAHTVFQAKKKGVSCTLYKSGKLMVQGKDKDEFIEFYLEPNILKAFEYGYEAVQPKSASRADTVARIGIDESGKGDFFGPLVVAGVYADAEGIAALEAMGVCDSKTINDKRIAVLAKKIRARCPSHVVRINPKRYNELYGQFKNLNKMLGWGHATAIEGLVEETGCRNAIIDQFASEHVVETALKRKNLDITLKQRPRAEEDPVVAAASILARDGFVQAMAKLSQTWGVELPKGASAKVKAAARAFVRKHGAEALPEVCKVHFKTYQEVRTG